MAGPPWVALGGCTGRLVARVICKAENGQLREDAGAGQGMEYPPWGLVSCWGGKLLRVKVPPPETRRGWGAGTERN